MARLTEEVQRLSRVEKELRAELDRLQRGELIMAGANGPQQLPPTSVGKSEAEKEKLRRAAKLMRGGGLPVAVLLSSGFDAEVLLSSGAATTQELRAAGVSQEDLEGCDSFNKHTVADPPPLGRLGVPVLDMAAARVCREHV